MMSLQLLEYSFNRLDNIGTQQYEALWFSQHITNNYRQILRYS